MRPPRDRAGVVVAHLVTADSAEYIARVVRANCPEAVRAADPFHVVKWANDALGEVRLETWRETRRIARANSRGRGRTAHDHGEQFPARERLKMLTRSRYALWKNPENLTIHQRAKLDWIAATDPRLWRAYQLKEGLRAIFKLPHDEAPEALDNLDRLSQPLPDRPVRRPRTHGQGTTHTDPARHRARPVQRPHRISEPQSQTPHPHGLRVPRR